MYKNILYFLLFIACLTLTACGSGGSDDNDNVTYTKATLTIELSGTLPDNTAIAGADFSLTLPTDVTPALIDNLIESGVVLPTGTFAGGTQTPPVYSPATPTTQGTLALTLANIDEAGITTVGEVATITLQLINGAAPTSTNFGALLDVIVIDSFGNPITGMDAKITNITLQ